MNEITAFFAFLRYSLGKKENMSRMVAGMDWQMLYSFAFKQALLACAILTFVATLIVVVCSGTLSLFAFFALYLGESIMFPTIFSLALRDAGAKTKLASSLLIMTIAGGAVAPVIMGYIADTTGSMAIAFLIPQVCYGVIGGYTAMPRYSSTDVGRG